VRLVVAALVVAAVAVIAVAAVRTWFPSSSARDPELRHVVDGVPDDWVAVAAKDAGVHTGPPFPGAYVQAFGTAGDPTRPAMEFVWRTDPDVPPFDTLAASSGMETMVVAGRRVACAPQSDGTVLCYVEEGDNSMQVRANGVTVDDMVEVFEALTFVDGLPVEDASTLPGGMRRLGIDGHDGPIGLVANGNADHRDVASLLYLAPNNTDPVLLVVGHADEQDLAYGGVTQQWRRIEQGGRTWFVTENDASTMVMWRDGDQVFWLRSSDQEALDLAATVRPATAAEWEAVPDRPPYDGTPIIPG
jgi:hypothetical protein